MKMCVDALSSIRELAIALPPGQHVLRSAESRTGAKPRWRVSLVMLRRVCGLRLLVMAFVSVASVRGGVPTAVPDAQALYQVFGDRDAAAFREPAQVFRPETWFHFIGGNVAKQGITADLEAIAGAGIAGRSTFSRAVRRALAGRGTADQVPERVVGRGGAPRGRGVPAARAALHDAELSGLGDGRRAVDHAGQGDAASGVEPHRCDGRQQRERGPAAAAAEPGGMARLSRGRGGGVSDAGRATRARRWCRHRSKAIGKICRGRSACGTRRTGRSFWSRARNRSGWRPPSQSAVTLRTVEFPSVQGFNHQLVLRARRDDHGAGRAAGGTARSGATRDAAEQLAGQQADLAGVLGSARPEPTASPSITSTP